MDEGSQIDGKSYDLKIKSSVRGVENTIPLLVNRRNILTSKELFGTSKEQCIRDEVFCFSTKICGIYYEINRAYLANANCKIDHLSSIAQDEIDEDNVAELRSLVDQVEIQARIGRSGEARETYRILKGKLRNYECGCDC